VRAEAVQSLEVRRECIRSQFDIDFGRRCLDVKRPHPVGKRHHNGIERGDPTLRTEFRTHYPSLFEP
jgi:hypothetical protein